MRILNPDVFLEEEAEDRELREAEMPVRFPDPEVKKQLRAAMQKRAETWVEQKIPALAGRTPMEAVCHPDGKEMVEGPPLDRERRDARGISPNQIRPQIGGLPRLLNLASRVS